MIKVYPKANQNRFHGSDIAVIPSRRGFLKAAAINFLLLQVLFLGLFSYIFGSLFQQNTHIHNLNILYVDYDGGIIGTSVRTAYQTLQGDGFPSLQEEASSRFPTPDDIERAVCSTQYWAALYTSPGASSRLEVALAGGSAAINYNRSDVLTYIWNEARYATVVDADIESNIQTLSSAARVAYTTVNGTGAVQVLALTDAAAISAFSDPWQLSDVNIQPTAQGSRVIYNTLVIILILIQEFFYLGTINGLYVQFKIYPRLYPHRIIAYRNLISLSYTFVGSLCTTGAIWAFRAGWNVNRNQFALSWAVLWLFAHANFLSLDVFTVWLPAQYVPMALISWVVLNITSILVPFELSAGFYRWAYAMPAHEVYQTLIDIWSRGCNPQVYYALPVLFSLEIIGLLLSALGVYRRCHFAVIAEEAQEKAFRERLDVAMAYERRRDREKTDNNNLPGSLEPENNNGDGDSAEAEAVEQQQRDDDETREREELAEVIRKENRELERERTKENRACNFGPSFDLPFGE